jgi:predicted dehydrogenase
MRVGLLGVSHWHAPLHAAAVEAAGAALSTVWDDDPATAAAFAARHGAAATASADQAIAGCDLVVVMGRPDGVLTLAQAAVALGRPMILEKPAARRAEPLAQLAALAATARAFVAVPLPNRLGPAMVELESLRTTGRAGKLAHAHFRLINGPPGRYRLDAVGWMLDPALSGGGALRNLGIHGVDGVLALASGTVRLVSATIGNRLHDESVEDYALLVLEDEAGAVFTVEAGYTFASMRPGGDFEWRIATANAYLVDLGETAHAATLDDEGRRVLEARPPSIRYNLFMADTLARLRAGRPPLVGLDDYVRAMRLIDQAYGASAK